MFSQTHLYAAATIIGTSRIPNGGYESRAQESSAEVYGRGVMDRAGYQKGSEIANFMALQTSNPDRLLTVMKRDLNRSLNSLVPEIWDELEEAIDETWEMDEEWKEMHVFENIDEGD
ncbi:hypothetical protein B7494_g8420 [Chlorociboria aeruginascens]|nr:hypothetical protein B7494_g8420 [Chlorociboria aeruginascens]